MGSHILKLLHVIHLSKGYDQNINEGSLILLGEKSFYAHFEIYKYIRIFILDDNDQVVSFESERCLGGCIIFTFK